jgi:DNA (cytosine-5)-methyltransferase 1
MAREGRRKKIKILDLFCGCGGSSLGFKLAMEKLRLNCEIVGVDINRDACITFQKNRIGQAVRADARFLPFRLKKGDFDILIGCPPCQGFTRMRGKPNQQDPRNALVKVYSKYVKSLLPKYLMFENVPWVRDSHFYHQLAECLKSCGYKYVSGVIDAADYGVPQRRKRLILVASLRGRPKLPEPEHNKVTVREAIGDLPPLEAGEKHPVIPNHVCMKHNDKVLSRIRTVPKDGGSRKVLPRELWLTCHLENKGYNDVYGRMKWDDVAPTLTTGCTNPSKGRFIHPEQDRAITPREAARIQTFPDWFVFFGGLTSISRQIGNAMPIKLAEAIALACVSSLGINRLFDFSESKKRKS